MKAMRRAQSNSASRSGSDEMPISLLIAAIALGAILLVVIAFQSVGGMTAIGTGLQIGVLSKQL